MAAREQGGPLSPLLANIYLNEFDHETEDKGVRFLRYADDIIIFAKSQRAAERMLGTCQKYLEGKMKLKMNMNKSTATSVFSSKFKFLGYTLGKSGQGIYIYVPIRNL